MKNILFLIFLCVIKIESNVQLVVGSILERKGFSFTAFQIFKKEPEAQFGVIWKREFFPLISIGGFVSLGKEKSFGFQAIYERNHLFYFMLCIQFLNKGVNGSLSVLLKRSEEISLFGGIGGCFKENSELNKISPKNTSFKKDELNTVKNLHDKKEKDSKKNVEVKNFVKQPVLIKNFERQDVLRQKEAARKTAERLKAERLEAERQAIIKSEARRAIIQASLVKENIALREFTEYKEKENRLLVKTQEFEERQKFERERFLKAEFIKRKEIQTQQDSEFIKTALLFLQNDDERQKFLDKMMKDKINEFITTEQDLRREIEKEENVEIKSIELKFAEAAKILKDQAKKEQDVKRQKIVEQEAKIRLEIQKKEEQELQTQKKEEQTQKLLMFLDTIQPTDINEDRFKEKEELVNFLVTCFLFNKGIGKRNADPEYQTLLKRYNYPEEELELGIKFSSDYDRENAFINMYSRIAHIVSKDYTCSSISELSQILFELDKYYGATLMNKVIDFNDLENLPRSITSIKNLAMGGQEEFDLRIGKSSYTELLRIKSVISQLIIPEEFDLKINKISYTELLKINAVIPQLRIPRKDSLIDKINARIKVLQGEKSKDVKAEEEKGDDVKIDKNSTEFSRIETVISELIITRKDILINKINARMKILEGEKSNDVKAEVRSKIVEQISIILYVNSNSEYHAFKYNPFSSMKTDEKKALNLIFYNYYTEFVLNKLVKEINDCQYPEFLENLINLINCLNNNAPMPAYTESGLNVFLTFFFDLTKRLKSDENSFEEAIKQKENEIKASLKIEDINKKANDIFSLLEKEFTHEDDSTKEEIKKRIKDTLVDLLKNNGEKNIDALYSKILTELPKVFVDVQNHIDNIMKLCNSMKNAIENTTNGLDEIGIEAKRSLEQIQRKKSKSSEKILINFFNETFNTNIFRESMNKAYKEIGMKNADNKNTNLLNPFYNIVKNSTQNGGDAFAVYCGYGEVSDKFIIVENLCNKYAAMLGVLKGAIRYADPDYKKDISYISSLADRSCSKICDSTSFFNLLSELRRLMIENGRGSSDCKTDFLYENDKEICEKLQIEQYEIWLMLKMYYDPQGFYVKKI